MKARGRRHALITGGAGFVGSYLAEELLDEGWSVEIIDDLSTGSIENISHLKEYDRFSYVIDTIMDQRLMAEMVDRAEYVFHLAAAVGVQLIVDEPVRTIKTNIDGTEILLDLASKKGKSVLLASTSEVYGKSAESSFAEDDESVIGPTSEPRWSYAASKIIDEYFALAFAAEQDLPVTVLRLFNTIGPRQTGQYGMVVPRFVRQALAGDPITVYGDGEQSRSFTWVRDVAWAMRELIQEPSAMGEVFNVGHTKEITILGLAEMIKGLIGSESKIEFIPFDEAYGEDFQDIPRRMPDTKKLRRTIGYRPSRDLPEMLKPIIEYHRQRR